MITFPSVLPTTYGTTHPQATSPPEEEVAAVEPLDTSVLVLDAVGLSPPNAVQGPTVLDAAASQQVLISAGSSDAFADLIASGNLAEIAREVDEGSVETSAGGLSSSAVASLFESQVDVSVGEFQVQAWLG